MLIKNFIRLIVLGLLLVITSPANHVKAQYDSDYGIDHGPLAPALSSEEIREIEKLFEEAKTEEAFKELWTIFKSFILAYKIGDSPKLVEAYEKFMAVRKIAVNCGVRLKDTKTKLGSILNAPAKELADFVTFTRPGTKTSIGLEIELLGSYSNMKADVVECHLSKDIPSGEAAKIKTVFNQEIKSKLSGKTYTDLEVARADIETYIISFLNALDKQLTFKGNADQETPDFDGEISLSDIPAFDEKKRNAEEVLTFQDFAGLPPGAARQISELLKNFESHKLESKKFHCRVVVTNEASKALPIGKDGISGTGSVFNDVTKQFNSDMAIAGGRDMALWLHYDESLKKLRYKLVLKGSRISPLFVSDREKNRNEPNPTELDGIRKRAILSAIKNTNLHSKSTTITDNQLSWVEMAIWAGRVGKEALAEIKVPEPMWKYDATEKYPVTLQPLDAGIGDGLIDELKAIPEFLTLVLSSFDEKQREEMVNAFKSIDAVQIIKDVYKDKAEKYTGTPDVVLHTAGVDFVILGSLLVGGEILEGIKLAKKVKEIMAALPDLAKRKIKNLDSPKDFFREIANNKDLFDKVKLDPSLIDGWGLMSKNFGPRSLLRKDPDVLKKVAEILADKKVLDAVGGEEGLGNILKAYKGKCKTCGDMGYKHLKNVDDYLADLKIFVTGFKDVDGFKEVVSAMKNTNDKVQDGLTHMLDKVKKYDPDNIAAFEGRIAEALADADDLAAICERCLFDVKFKNGSFAEFKSYSLETIQKISGPLGKTFNKQFRQYLQGVSNIEELRYIFNKSKIQDLLVVKGEFKKMFLNNTEEIFDVIWNNQSLRTSLFPRINDPIKGLDAFNKSVNNMDSNLYKFIKIE